VTVAAARSARLVCYDLTDGFPLPGRVVHLLGPVFEP